MSTQEVDFAEIAKLVTKWQQAPSGSPDASAAALSLARFVGPLMDEVAIRDTEIHNLKIVVEAWQKAAELAAKFAQPAKYRALDVALTGLRKLRDYYQIEALPAVNAQVVGRDLSILLSKVDAS